MTSLQRIINKRTNDEKGAAACTPLANVDSPTKTAEKLEAIDICNSDSSHPKIRLRLTRLLYSTIGTADGSYNGGYRNRMAPDRMTTDLMKPPIHPRLSIDVCERSYGDSIEGYRPPGLACGYSLSL